MKRLIGVLIAAAIAAVVCSAAGAQGTLEPLEVRTTAGPVAPGATVTVCSYNASQYTGLTYTGPIPCSPTVMVYYDAQLESPQSNPLTANYRGEANFYANAGTYTVTEQGPGLVSKGFAITLTCAPSSTNASCGSNSGGGNVTTTPAPSVSQQIDQLAGTLFGANLAGFGQINGTCYPNQNQNSDWPTAINACFTQAGLTGTGTIIVDARGLSGSQSSVHHITIPAGGLLLWGNAELTISDSGTNDAIELGGDGASVVGTQESGSGTVSRPQTDGYIACAVAGCTTVRNPNASTANVDWVHIEKMFLLANGASSRVIDLTSVGHARIQDNQLTVGTGGGSYGIYGDTSTGEHDSTNDVIQHNQINLESSNDVCVRLAGIFNINVLEINSCYMAAANTGQEGFIYAKDSGGNYPNNSLLYGNDSEQGGAGTSFGTIGYDIQGATSITISNNRCEKVYACYKFPSDGSADGIHFIDNYLSISNQIQVLPNEPQTSEMAIDNNGHNWLPSMHFGQSDLAGTNLLGNADFEAWAGSTTLFYWGGVSGSSINQAGSGIYAQQSSGSGIADTTTQGSYNVLIGDNATAGLGINSGCIRVDSTMNYTLAFRVASTSTSVKFRPGFRFYSDANCTEADKITNVATNARVLAPANYAGQSALLSTSGPNWQTTNASLTYNNGMSCNCNVTGADWTVGTASAWTPTRNYAITFRVPNAYSNAATVAQSMRVFILENSAANPNQVYVDDVALAEGPVASQVPFDARVNDSNGAMYGNPLLNGDPFGIYTGSFTANDAVCANANASGAAPLVLKDCGGVPLTSGSGLQLPFAIKSASFSLSTAQANVELSGIASGQTLTVPHALPAANTSQLWFVWNNSNQTWTEACDSGNIIGTGSSGASTTLAADYWNLLTADGTNCWVLASGSGSGGANTALSNLTNPTAVNQNLSPSTVNTYALGISTFPWKNLFIGNGANQAAYLNGDLLTGNRKVEFPDEPGTLMMNTDVLGCSQLGMILTGGDITNSNCDLTLNDIQGVPIAVTAPVAGQFLQYNGTAFVNTPGGQCTNPQTGSSYTVLATDRGCIVAATNSGAQAYSLPQAGTTGFAGSFYTVIANLPNSTTPATGVVTVTTTTSVFENLPGQPSSFVLYPNQRVYIWSIDNANWWVMAVTLPPGYGTTYNVDYANVTSAEGSSGSPITMITAPANGAYTLHANLSCHTQVSTATIALTFKWTDPGGTARSVTSSTATCTTLGTSDEVSVTREINVGSGQAVTYYTAIANSPHYDLNLTLVGAY
jgi:hypothetical protein